MSDFGHLGGKKLSMPMRMKSGSMYGSTAADRRWAKRKTIPLKVTNEELRVVAPYLWVRQDRFRKQE